MNRIVHISLGGKFQNNGNNNKESTNERRDIPNHTGNGEYLDYNQEDSSEDEYMT